ncbi:MAG TPA: FAD-dependent oxidoreductase, partial [Chitinophagaceae bacterium]|nr:FAD-dependent oxidoreductase [Chitinophagaceae bacterium]
MKADYLIIGKGLSGTFLSYYLQKAGKKVLVIDDANPHTASRVASGVINPVTGRSVVATWMIEDLLPFCLQAYKEIGNAIGKNVIEEKNILAFPPTVQMREAYNKRLHEKSIYLKEVNANDFNEYFNYPFGCVEILQVLSADVQTLLLQYRQQLIQQDLLVSETFDEDLLHTGNDEVKYKNITAEKIFYCSGIHTYKSKYWKNIPYVLNKGEALLVEIPALPVANIFKFAN